MDSNGPVRKKALPSRTFLPAPCHQLQSQPGVRRKEGLQLHFLLVPKPSLEILLI